MKNMLVYCIPYYKGKVQKWQGFYDKKRFIIIGDNTAELLIDEQQGKYIIQNKEQECLLPEGIRKLMYAPTVPNHYFLMTDGIKAKETSIEVVMQLIEQGYDIDKISMKPYCEKLLHRNDTKPYLCKYISEGKTIVTILNEDTIIWREIDD